jgi:hypothetical protein
MDENMAKTKVDSTGVILALVGALVYLYVVYRWSFAPAFAATGWGASASFWLPVFAGIGAVATLSLLLVSVAGLFGMATDASKQWAMRVNTAAGVALFGLTAGGALFWYVAVAFILGHFGTAKQNM